MANKEESIKLFFKVDLCEQASHHLDFLKSVDSVSELSKTDLLRRAIYRYERFWLPLAADHPEECLVAPLDIEWVWHCHMLNPQAYENDCLTILGKTIKHTLYNPTQFQEKQNVSRIYWLQKYENKDEPFSIDFPTNYDQTQDATFKSQMKYDIYAATQRQMSFYYQVSLPHYRDKNFLENSVSRYKQFLFMKTKVTQDFLVPCYDIDLIWHSHQLNPVVYKEDMVRIIGHLFNHDDDVNDRSEDSPLNAASKETSENWKTFYTEFYLLNGAMYRGKPPTGRLHETGQINFNFEKEYGYTSKTSIISFKKLTLTMSPECSHTNRQLQLKASSTKDHLIVEQWFMVKGQTKTALDSCTLVLTDVGHYTFDTKTASGIKFELQSAAGHACCKSKIFVGSNTIDIMPIINDFAYAEAGGPIKAEVTLGDIILDIEGRFSAPFCQHYNEIKLFLRGKTLLRLETGKYQTVTIPEDVQELLGPVALERRPQNASCVCKAATHRLKSTISGTTVFTVKVIHSQSMLMSVIQVFYNDEVVAIAHLIGSDQLPLPTQVKKEVITLNPKQGQRAIVIKNNKGDWGIVVGQWTGFKRGAAATYSKNAVYGSPGSLSVQFYKVVSGEVKMLPQNHGHLSLESTEIELGTGIIQVDTKSKEIAENIALAFSVSLLHVLCIPRPEGWQDGQTVAPEEETRGKKAICVIPSDHMSFIVAAGLHSSTPSNYNLSFNYGNKKCTMNDFEDLPGKNDRDPNCNGCGCGGSKGLDTKEFISGNVGAGCGGCGSRACRSECGGSECGSGKGRCASDYKGYSLFGTRSDHDKMGISSSGVGSTDVSVTLDPALDVCDNNSGGGGGDGGSGFDCF